VGGVLRQGRRQEEAWYVNFFLSSPISPISDGFFHIRVSSSSAQSSILTNGELLQLRLFFCSQAAEEEGSEEVARRVSVIGSNNGQGGRTGAGFTTAYSTSYFLPEELQYSQCFFLSSV
jgi:hypothetical protein